jgi:hypothetical protein
VAGIMGLIFKEVGIALETQCKIWRRIILKKFLLYS